MFLQISMNYLMNSIISVCMTPAKNSVVSHYGAVVRDVDPDGPAAKTDIEGLEPNLAV
jgi:hypothetical protein